MNKIIKIFVIFFFGLFLSYSPARAIQFISSKDAIEYTEDMYEMRKKALDNGDFEGWVVAVGMLVQLGELENQELSREKFYIQVQEGGEYSAQIVKLLYWDMNVAIENNDYDAWKYNISRLQGFGYEKEAVISRDFFAQEVKKEQFSNFILTLKKRLYKQLDLNCLTIDTKFDKYLCTPTIKMHLSKYII